MDLNIEAIPKALRGKLEAQATRNNRTLEDEVRAILVAAMKTDEATPSAPVAENVEPKEVMLKSKDNAGTSIRQGRS